MSGILVVAATPLELVAAAGWRTLVCGVGPVEAASATAAAIAQAAPRAVLHVGIAGSRRRPALVPPQLVIGTEARYMDLAPDQRFVAPVLLPDARLLAAAREALPDAVAAPIGTSARVGGTSGCDVEAMEGYAVLRAAERAGIPAIEVRAISNEIDETDRTRWQFEAAFAAITTATSRLVPILARCVS